MPHGRATEKRFLIAVQGEKVWGALEYRVTERSLFLGSLLTEPWAQERLLPARALYAEARVLAREAGLWEVRADANSWDDYPYEVRYQRQGRVWRVDPQEPLVLRSELPEGGWRRMFTPWGSLPVPFFRAFPC